MSPVGVSSSSKLRMIPSFGSQFPSTLSLTSSWYIDHFCFEEVIFELYDDEANHPKQGLKIPPTDNGTLGLRPGLLCISLFGHIGRKVNCFLL